MLSSDGPNVNAVITNLVDKELTDSHLPMVVDIGSCSLRKVHNAFAKRLATLRILPRIARDTVMPNKCSEIGF